METSDRESRLDIPIDNGDNLALECIFLIHTMIPELTDTHDNLTNSHRSTRKQNMITFPLLCSRSEFLKFLDYRFYHFGLVHRHGDAGVEDFLERDRDRVFVGGCGSWGEGFDIEMRSYTSSKLFVLLISWAFFLVEISGRWDRRGEDQRSTNNLDSLAGHQRWA